jgi:hypothetical protein
MENMDLTNFVLIGNNREEAYKRHMEFEMSFNDPDNPYLRMGFIKFCKELSKGYGNSNWIQIGRLYEAPDGKIWYDNDYCG